MSVRRVSMLFQRCFKGVSRKFSRSFKEVSIVFQENLKGISREF